MMEEYISCMYVWVRKGEVLKSSWPNWRITESYETYLLYHIFILPVQRTRDIISSFYFLTLQKNKWIKSSLLNQAKNFSTPAHIWYFKIFTNFYSHEKKKNKSKTKLDISPIYIHI